MTDEWISSKETIEGFPCLQHRVTLENAIFGDRGEIWAVNSSTCKCRYFTSEKVVTFPNGELKKYLKRIRASRVLRLQIEAARRDKIKNRSNG